jgi:hypothetical protein
MLSLFLFFVSGLMWNLISFLDCIITPDYGKSEEQLIQLTNRKKDLVGWILYFSMFVVLTANLTF